jgi:hypothetical protein
MPLATIAPVDLAVDEGKTVSPASIEAENLAIRTSAKRRNLQLIRLEQLQNFVTIDGMHPKPSEEGYQAWDDAIIAGLKKAIGCDASAVR